MKLVLGTNVLVSAVLSPNGASAAVLRLLLTEQSTLCFDERILSEYRDVLDRSKLVFDVTLVDELLNFLELTGTPVLAPPMALELPHPWDQMFVEVTSAGSADFLVTGNPKDFPSSKRAGVEVVTPRELLKLLLP